MLHELRKHWQTISTDSSVNFSEVDRDLDSHLPTFQRPTLEAPTLESLRGAFRRARPAAPGPERLTAKARLADERHTETLHDVMFNLFRGHAAPWGFNLSDMTFTPKGYDPMGMIDVRRRAATVRPLSFKNAGARAIASATNLQLAALKAERCRVSQQ
eukprot:8935945-Pyramimonas_sp.AAC.1